MTNGLSVNDITPLGERPADVWRGRTGTLGAGVFTIAGSALSGTPTTTGDVFVYDAATDSWVIVNDSTFGNVSWFNVKTYGAVGDGSTDDTAAINLAIAALNSAGRGVLYFPAAIYKTTAALTTITAQAQILGDGSGAWDQTAPVSQVTCTSQTAVLFTVTSASGSFHGMSLRNTYGGTPTSASKAILQTPSTGLESWSFEDVATRGFYTNIEIDGATGWAMHRCWNYGPVSYGLFIKNSVIADAGDWSISDSGFFAAVYNSNALVHIESSGGGKFVNCKFNRGTDSPAKQASYGIEISVQSSTSVLLVTGCSFENMSSDAIHGTSGASTKKWAFGVVTGCQFGLYSNNSGFAVSLNSTTASDFNTWLIAGNVFHTDGTARAAISLTKTDLIQVGQNRLSGNFTSYITSSSATNTLDYTGGIAGGTSVVPDGNAAHYLDGTGAFTTPSAGMTNPMTTLWDVIVGGTVTAGVAAPTRLGIGNAGANLAVVNSTLEWNADTAFPGSKATNDRWYRTDGSVEYTWDGTRWVCTCAHYLPMPNTDTLLPYATTGTTHRVVVPVAGSTMRIYTMTISFFVSGGGSALGASHNWSLQLKNAVSGANVGAALAINSGASATWRQGQVSINANVALTEFELEILSTKTGTPGSLYAMVQLDWRIVNT